MKSWGQAQVLGECGRQEQAGVSDQAGFIESYVKAVEGVRRCHLLGVLLLRRVLVLSTALSQFRSGTYRRL